jgi:hypothetical protein
MRRLFAVMASIAINMSVLPAVASECTLQRDIDATRLRWSTLRSQPTNTADNEKTCRAYASSFYEAVTLRQAIAWCLDRERRVAILDSEINAFNDLLASKCGS